MILYAVYIIASDGKEMLSEIYQSPENVPNSTILSALLTAFQNVSESLTNREGTGETLNLSGLVYHVQFFGDFMVVIVTNGENRPSKLLDTLGWRFLRDYGEKTLNWMGNQTMFDPFRSKMKDIILKHTDIDVSGSIDPAKSLDTSAIYKLPKHVQQTALALLGLERATFDEILEEVGSTTEELDKNLEFLHDNGYIGITEKGGITKFFAVV